MQDYKIKVLNPDISRQVQEKAFELGYLWNGSRDRLIRNSVQLYLHQDGSITRMYNDDVEYFD